MFDLETGEPVDGPARDPLPLFGAREVDGWIELSVDAGRLSIGGGV